MGTVRGMRVFGQSVSLRGRPAPNRTFEASSTRGFESTSRRAAILHKPTQIERLTTRFMTEFSGPNDPQVHSTDPWYPLANGAFARQASSPESGSPAQKIVAFQHA